MLRATARQGHVVPGLAHTLIAVAKFCDAGYVVTFNKDTVHILDNDNVILTGSRHLPTGLWHLDIGSHVAPPIHIHFANKAGDSTEAELVAYAHATLFSPTISTLETALRNNFLHNFPGLTTAALHRHPPRSMATAKGHLDQTRQNLRSTKPAVIDPDPDDPAGIPDDPFPEQVAAKTHECYVAVFEPTGQIYSDQTGRFIAPSTTGNNYIMIVYDYDSNHIFAEPFCNQTAKCLLEAFQTIHTKLLRAGLQPKLHRLDNECSTIFKEYLKASNIDFQLVPPGMHRRNSAERAIRTFQKHFIAGLCSTDKAFPIALWDHLIPQAEITLNLLRGSRINPKLSAHAQIHGAFDFNRTPLGPPGCRVLAHVKPDNRRTWSPHGLEGWYIGPALDSYRCYRIWIQDTRAPRICDTVTWFPSTVRIPSSSSNDEILAALRDISNALRRPSPRTPIAPRSDSLTAALQQLTDILTTIVVPEDEQPTPTPATLPEPAPPLRVATDTVATPTPDPSQQPNIIPLDDDEPSDNQPPNEPPPPPEAPAIVPLDSQPLAPESTEPTPVVPPIDPPADPLPTAPPTTTYNDLTGPQVAAAKRRQRRQRTAKHKTPTRRSKRQQNKIARALEAFAADMDALDALDYFDDTLLYMCCHGTALNPDTGQIAEYQELLKSSDGKHWSEANDEEVGRMCTGLGPDTSVPTGTETLEFIAVTELPSDKKPTYVRVVCADRPEKPQPRRVRWTLGGDKIVYLGNKTTRTADLVTAKLLLNSVLSTPGAKFMTIDLKDFYLNSTLPEPEYVRVPVHMVKKGMYGLPQAGKLANDELVAHLKPFGYVPCDVTPGLWKDTNSDLMFSLVVDDFGVRYTNPDDVNRLVDVLQQKYKTSLDWTGSRYVGLTLEWDYKNRTLDISMPGYVARALERFAHPTPRRHEASPHAWSAPVYGSRQQYATNDDSPFLDLKDKTRVQEVVGTFLYYARAVDLTMLAALGTIASQQSNPTQNTMKAVTQFLNYAASNPDAKIRYYASGMQLYIESDASYLSEPKARSRVAGYHYLGPDLTTLPPGTHPPNNGPVTVPCKIIRNVLASAAEAELAGLFTNGQEAIPERITLEELGHPQGPTPMVTDNATASGIANESIKQKRSKSMDMRFYWIRDQVRQGHFRIYWRRGGTNRADYPTKHHPAKHHIRMRPHYLHTEQSNRYAPLDVSD